MTIKPLARRAFSGMVGLPPEPDEAVVAPAPGVIATQEPSDV
jgi:hypothetical protein